MEGLGCEIFPTPRFTSSDINLRRSVIKPPESTPTYEAGIDVNALLRRLDMRDLYRLVLDVKLSPKLSDAKVSEPHLAHCCWSPSGMFQEHRCLIASLTNLGCLKLHVPYFSNWLEIADISKIWVDHCCLQWHDEDIPTDFSLRFDTLKKRVFLIKFNVMIWNHQIMETEGVKYSRLITISHDGTLAVWKIPQLADLRTFSEEYKPHLINTFETNVDCSTALLCFWWSEKKCSIIIGNLEGCIKIATLTFDGDNITLISIKDVWTFKDRMLVSGIKSLPASSLHPDDQRIIGVTKNDYFLVFLVSEDGVKASSHKLVGNLTITGMEVKDEKSFLVCTLPGHFWSFSVKIDQSPDGLQIHLERKAFKTGISWNDVSCFGVVRSPFTNLWAVGTSTCKLYDHLVMRRPSQIVLMSVKDVADPVEQIINTPLKPRYMLECLEIMRLSFFKSQEPPQLTYSHYPDDLETLSTNQLQLELWRCRIVLAQVTAADMKARQMEASAFVSLIEELILCRHASERIRELTAKHEKEPLDEKSLSSLGLLRSWLHVWWLQSAINDSQPTESKRIKKETSIEEVAIDEMEFLDTSGSNVNMEQTSSKEFVDMDESSSGSEDISVSSFSGKTQEGQPNKRVSPSFLKVQLTATRDQVADILALAPVPGTPEKEICEFCEQASLLVDVLTGVSVCGTTFRRSAVEPTYPESAAGRFCAHLFDGGEIQMDHDWRVSVCPANHQMSRCSFCFRRCRGIPQRLCLVCPLVACADPDHHSHCIFCDSVLVLDEKFTIPAAFKSIQPEAPLSGEAGEEEDSISKPDSVPEDEPMEFDA